MHLHPAYLEMRASSGGAEENISLTQPAVVQNLGQNDIVLQYPRFNKVRVTRNYCALLKRDRCDVATDWVHVEVVYKNVANHKHIHL